MKKTIQSNILLFTPSGKVMAPVKITYDDNESIPDPKSEITLLYNGVEYNGIGSDDLWTDTFADLQIKLPKDVELACCMTCRHGNMCPYGNVENKLFCTKDLVITGKEDMCNLFDRTGSVENRAVASLDYCDDFICQSETHYTYNDYLYQLSKKKHTLCGGDDYV